MKTSGSKKIDWDKDFLRRVSAYESMHEALDVYNSEHGTNVKFTSFASWLNRNGIKVRTDVFTKEQNEFLKKHYGKNGVHIEILKDMFNDKFGTHKTYAQIRAACSRQKLKADSETRSIAHKGKACSLEVGETSKDWKQPRVKLGNGEFIAESRYVYEQNYGELNKGEVVLHLDGNNLNNNPDNLFAVTKAEKMRMSRNGLFSSNQTLTKAGVMLCRLKQKIKDAEKEEGIWQ